MFDRTAFEWMSRDMYIFICDPDYVRADMRVLALLAPSGEMVQAQHPLRDVQQHVEASSMMWTLDPILPKTLKNPIQKKAPVRVLGFKGSFFLGGVLGFGALGLRARGLPFSRFRGSGRCPRGGRGWPRALPQPAAGGWWQEFQS